MKIRLQTISFIVVCVLLIFSVVQAVQVDNLAEQVAAAATGTGGSSAGSTGGSRSLETSDIRIPAQAAPPAMVGGC